MQSVDFPPQILVYNQQFWDYNQIVQFYGLSPIVTASCAEEKSHAIPSTSIFVLIPTLLVLGANTDNLKVSSNPGFAVLAFINVLKCLGVLQACSCTLVNQSLSSISSFQFRIFEIMSSCSYFEVCCLFQTFIFKTLLFCPWSVFCVFLDVLRVYQIFTI